MMGRSNTPEEEEPTREMPAAFSDETHVIPAELDETAPLPPVGHAAARADSEHEPFLLAENLTATGPEGPIYTNLSLAAERGDTVALLGDSGTGRTSALLTLAGRFIPRSGKLRVNHESSPRRIRELVAIAAAPPAVDVEENHTVAQLVTETTLVSRASRPAIQAARAKLVPGVESTLPFGQVPKVERVLLKLAFASASDAPVIAIDDVDEGVDSRGVGRIWDALRRLASEGRLILATGSRLDTHADQTIRIEAQGSYAEPL